MDSSTPSDTQAHKAKTLLHVVYALYAASFVFGFTSIVGVILAHIKAGEAAGTWLGTHYRWQIRSFWFGLLWAVIGMLTAFLVVGWFVLVGVAVWFIYRIVKGWVYLADGNPMY